MTRLLVVGAGHAHAQVLRDWIDAPVRGTELVVVSPSALAPYSGMVPGWLAGRYRYEEICIDFAALAAAAGARLIVDELIQLDPDLRQVRLRSGLALDYDVLSLNVGSTLNPPASGTGKTLCLRPLSALHQAWDALLDDLAHAMSDAPLQVTAVGGGAAGVEAMLAALHRLRLLQPGRPVQAALLSRGTTLLEGLAPGAMAAAHAALVAAGVLVRLDTAFSELAARPGGLLLWATGAEAHAWQGTSGLAVSARGFICVDRCLRSVSHPQVHAAGDCAEWAEPLPKAGVYAVRMGPVLSRNLRAALASEEPREYIPQGRFLM